MPKNPTHPRCFDEVKQITITALKKLGYLRSNALRRGYLCWERAGRPSGNINITVSVPDRYVELGYLRNGKCVNYRVNLERIPAHFGGYNWYFTCPETGKRCSSLYAIGERFLSRFAYPSAMYSKQIEKKSLRGIFSTLTSEYHRRDFLQTRHARTTYKGKLTKRYARMLVKRDGHLNKHVPIDDNF